MKKILVVADLETYEVNEAIDIKKKTVESYVYSAGYSIIQWGNITEDRVKTFFGIKNEALFYFFEALKEEAKKMQVSNIDLYFHNASYDSAYIGDFILSINPKWKVDFLYTAPKRDFINGSFTYKGIKFKIHCSYLWSRKSLASYPVKDGNGNRIDKLDLEESYGKYNLRESKIGWVYQTVDKQLHKFDKELEEKYLRRDVFKLHYILIHILKVKEGFWNNIEKDNTLFEYSKFVGCKTIPAISKKSIESSINEYLDETPHHKQENYFRPLLNEGLRMELDATLKGGLTTNNIYLSKNIVGLIDTELDGDKEIPTGWIKVGQYYLNPDVNIYSFDVNSMYPFIMNGRIPKGIPKLFEGKVEKDEEIYFYFLTSKIRAKKPYQQLRTIILGGTTTELLQDNEERKNYENIQKVLIRKDNLFFVLSMYDIWVNDIQITKENIWTVAEVVYVWKTSQQLAPFMKETYKKRNEYKKKRDSFPVDSADYAIYDTLQEVNKLLMNSAFGKLCQKTIESAYRWDENKVSITEQEEDNVMNYSTAGGNFVTMEGRTNILKAIKEVIDADQTFLYADTDSITFQATNSRWMDIVNREHFNYETKSNKGELGVLKFEGEYNIYISSPKKKRYAKYNYFLDNWEHWKKGNDNVQIEKVLNFAFGGFDKKKLYEWIRSHIPTKPTTETGFLLPVLRIFRPDINILCKGFNKQVIRDKGGFNHIRIINGDRETNENLKKIDYVLEKNKLRKYS